VLLVAEAATLAHVARPLVLGAMLDRSAFEVAFACDSSYKWTLRDFDGTYYPLWSKDSVAFTAALQRGSPLFDEATLERYVSDDLALLGEAAPDVVAGDFRLSLSVGAQTAGIPYIAISNCYWSPYWRPRPYTVPNLPITRYLPVTVAQALFDLAQPLAFALHARALNKVRRRHGLAGLGQDLRRIYTDADYVLYADPPELFPAINLPPHHRFVGPLLWTPPVPLPSWWTSIPDQRTVVYVTMGSSGDANLLHEILRGLEPLEVSVMLATAGATLPSRMPRNVYAATYLPGGAAARRSQLVVCNGGSPTTQQALTAGVPVVGIASNLDQFLNMDRIVQSGAGVTVRADRFNATSLRTAVVDTLSDPRFRGAAQGLAGAIARNKSHESFAALLCAASVGAEHEPAPS